MDLSAGLNECETSKIEEKSSQKVSKDNIFMGLRRFAILSAHYYLFISLFLFFLVNFQVERLEKGESRVC